ncbi:hypothetical protein [Thermincola potens]|uniref:Uncharacterized protein n=1 Tax=Thermincola potens (strain JR) TaxID=635013 RepID=D5X7G4_THEPJ|nr:hypothetical protein [Thermincola potens]ADG82534.1 conserved hypothetical protein [Thermincola potens JR]
MVIYGIIVIILAYMVTYSIVPVIGKMLAKADFVRPNFRGDMIPLGVGIVFALTLLVTGSVWILLQPDQARNTLLFLFAAFSMALLGLVDDVFGSREASGLKGHLKKLLVEGELTTGALKALAGGMVSLLISLALIKIEKIQDILLVLLNTFIIALSTNAINLLDLRPGRAIKGYLLLAAFLVAFGYNQEEVWLLGILTGSVLAYLPFDLKAQTMMGDTGSNVLGISVGLLAVLVLPLTPKSVYFGLLVLFHLYTEKFSLTRTIENNRVLKFIDMIGREK